MAVLSRTGQSTLAQDSKPDCADECVDWSKSAKRLALVQRLRDRDMILGIAIEFGNYERAM